MCVASFRTIPLKIAASASLVLLATKAFGQDCEIADLGGAPSGAVTQAAQANFDCLLSKIDALEQELAPFREAKGAVLAFDRSEAVTGDAAGGACPTGWTLFREAGGRFIIGAGQHENVNANGQSLRSYPSFSDSSTRAVGGEEKHALSLAEMPPHSHSIGAFDSGVGDLSLAYKDIQVLPVGSSGFFTHSVYARGDGLVTEAKPHDHAISGATGSSGDGNEYSNMPPYIALYFCKKQADQ